MPRCPTCNKQFTPNENAVMPFCSERCKIVDLGRWLDEAYTIPDDQLQQVEEENATDPALRDEEWEE